MTKLQRILATELTPKSTLVGAEREKIATRIQVAIQKLFPKSGVSSSYSTFLGIPSIAVRFTLGKDRNNWSNGILENDPAKSSLAVNFYKDGSVSVRSGFFSIYTNKPKPGMALGRIVVPFRKQTFKDGNFDNVFKKVMKSFTELKKTLKENKDIINGADLLTDQLRIL